MDAVQFYNKYRPMALIAARGSKIFPNVILAAASIESRNGASSLSSKYNNFFGIKAGTSWKGKTVKLETFEQVGNTKVKKLAAFRAYNSPKDSFADYVALLNQPRYKAVKSAKNEIEQIKAIKSAGYATDANYVNLLVTRLKQMGAKTKIALSFGAIVLTFTAYLILSKTNN